MKDQEIFRSIYKNGMEIRVFHAPNGFKDAQDRPQDVIQLWVKPAKSKGRGWTMTNEEAVEIAYALLRAVCVDNQGREA